MLSHTHLDHTAGLDQFLDPMDKPTVYLHPEVWAERYLTETPAGDPLLDPVYLGIPFLRAEIESGGELVEHREPVAVAPDVFALSEIPRPHIETTVGKIARDGTLVDDPSSTIKQSPFVRKKGPRSFSEAVTQACKIRSSTPKK